ncbi:MAG: chitobiase/beta-hexosaminidase C-terminal domain-containing protein [Gammaproteobacteria bacterium]|nr:chitobiase/beta-hexosaminidase C-terminal domain-containing protein [Gammaproteobacteria bacterium]
MNLRTIAIGVGAALVTSSALAELSNGDFADFDQPADGTTSGYDSGQAGPPGWFLTTSFDGGTLSFSDDGAASGRGYFSFNDLVGPVPGGAGFGASKLEQCVPIDAEQTVSIGFSVFADAAEPNSDLRIRVNPNFYATREECLLDLIEDSGDRRLSGGRDNDDFDHRFSAGQARTWLTFSAQEPPSNPDGSLQYEVADLTEGTTYMNLSLRGRDRSGISPPPEVRFDNIVVTQGSSTENLVVNAGFEHAELFDGAPIAAAADWLVSRDGDATARAAVGPQDFALSSGNVFYFEDLTGNFGFSRLDQCITLDGEDISPSVFAYTAAPDAGLGVRLNVDFYASDDCSGDASGDLRVREDFDLDIPASTWTSLSAGEIRTPGEYADAVSVLFSLRVRDRSGPDNGPGATQRLVFFDDASAVSAIATPTFSPGPGSYVDSVTVTLNTATDGAVIYYTLDGSTPDDTSSNVPAGGTVEITSTSTLTARAFLDGNFSAARSGDYTITAPPAPPPPPPAELSTGCSVSGQPSPLDPTLWVLAGLAGMSILWRRRRARQR